MTVEFVLQQWLPFAAAAVLFLLTPGPAVLYVVARSVAGGLTAGIATTVGIAIGNLIQVLVLSIGLGGLLASNPESRMAVLLAGSVYLVFIGIRQYSHTLIANQTVPAIRSTADMSTGPRQAALVDATIISVLNPKSILFLFAFVPQFTADTDVVPIMLQLFLLGLIYVLIALVTDAAYACAGARVSLLFTSRNPNRTRRMQQFSAGLVILIGLAGLMSAYTGV